MDKHNDKKARAKLKSYVPAYDKAGLWEEINDQLPAEKEDRKGLWFWIVGGGLVFVAIVWLAVYPIYTNSEVQSEPSAPRSVANRQGSVPPDLTTAEAGKEECVDTDPKNNQDTTSPTTQSTAVAAAPMTTPRPSATMSNVVGKQETTGTAAKGDDAAASLKLGFAYLAERPITADLAVVRRRHSLHLTGAAETDADAAAPLARRLEAGILPLLPLADVNPLAPTDRIPPTPDVKPHTPPSRPSKVAIVAAFAVGQSNRDFSSLNGQFADYVNERNATEEALYQLQANLSAEWPIYKGLYTKVGLHYEQQVETYTDNRIVSSMTEEVTSDSAGYLTLPDGSTTYFSGTTEQTTDVHRNILSYNRYHSLGVTVGLGYRLHFGRLAFLGEAAYLWSPLRWQSGSALSPDLQIEPLHQASHRANTLSRYQLAAGVEYAFTPHYSLFGKLAYLADLSNRSTVENTELAYRNLNVGLGVRLGF